MVRELLVEYDAIENDDASNLTLHLPRVTEPSREYLIPMILYAKPHRALGHYPILLLSITLIFYILPWYYLHVHICKVSNLSLINIENMQLVGPI